MRALLSSAVVLVALFSSALGWWNNGHMISKPASPNHQLLALHTTSFKIHTQT